MTINEMYSEGFTCYEFESGETFVRPMGPPPRPVLTKEGGIVWVWANNNPPPSTPFAETEYLAMPAQLDLPVSLETPPSTQGPGGSGLGD